MTVFGHCVGFSLTHVLGMVHHCTHMLEKSQTSSLPECKPRPRPSLALVFLSLTICFVLVLACCGQHDPQKSMAALKLFQSILGPRGPTSKKTSMAAFKGTQDTLGPRSPTPPKKQMLAHSRGPVRPLGGEGERERERERERFSALF